MTLSSDVAGDGKPATTAEHGPREKPITRCRDLEFPMGHEAHSSLPGPVPSCPSESAARPGVAIGTEASGCILVAEGDSVSLEALHVWRADTLC